MNHSSKYFCNLQCEYYPCHQGLEDMNCLFCFCPLYFHEHCPGNPSTLRVNGKEIKDCSNCVFPHLPQNYDVVMAFLKNKK